MRCRCVSSRPSWCSTKQPAGWACRAPRRPRTGDGLRERRAFFYLTRSGQPSPLRRAPYRYSKRLARLVAAVRADPDLQVQIVPVSVFFGRAPRHQDSLIKALLADAWTTPGPLQQFVRLLVHGRQTLVKFGPPLELRALLRAGAEEPGNERDLRRVARLLRAEFRNERELAIGPNLSHRQTVVNEIIDSEPVQQAVRDEAQRAGVSIERAELGARRMAVEIASDYSYPFIRAYDIALTALWNRLYDGVEVHRFETIASAGTGAEIVYLPCHRSHIDYLLLSYVIYHRGLLPPHIAAGVNLNLPVVGAMLRRGGAFFLRRSFKGEPLYAAIFAEYLHTILRRGFPIEYFVEGGRSRSGLTLPAKAGLLAMTVDSFLREPARPVVFVPVYIGYEQLIEAASYAAELAGKPKQKESLAGLVRGLLALRKRSFGKVHVAIGEPIRLAELLDTHWPRWRDEARSASPTAPVADRAISALSTLVVTRINEALVVNPINLFATAMLGAPAPAMDAQRLAEQIDLMRSLLQAIPYSPLQQVSSLSGAEVIDYAAGQGLAVRQAHPLGDIVTVLADRSPLLTYYRNNVLHAFAEASLLACFVVQAERIAEDALLDACLQMLPFLRAELFLSADDGTAA
jgi:glycerol-3-phosphate O-acyltransferase